MTPQSASISPRTPRTFRKSPDPAPKSAAFAACMRGWMSSVRRGDLQLRNGLAGRRGTPLPPPSPPQKWPTDELGADPTKPLQGRASAYERSRDQQMRLD